MPFVNKIEIIRSELDEMHDLFSRVVWIIPGFSITGPKIFPYGLKPHTSSVSWLVEQVVVQQAKYNRRHLNIKDVEFNLPDKGEIQCGEQ